MNTIYQMMIKGYKPCNDLLDNWFYYYPTVPVPFSNLKGMISGSLRKKTLIRKIPNA